jgi:hypothetical protein
LTALSFRVWVRTNQRSVNRLATTRVDLAHLVLKRRDPGIDPMNATRRSIRMPRVAKLVHPRGGEDRSDVVCREAV